MRFPGVRQLGSTSHFLLRRHVHVERKYHPAETTGEGHPAGLVIHRMIVDKDHRGKGLAHKALKSITHYADKTKQHIYLHPEPIADKPMNREQLESMYRKHGFEYIAPGTMHRAPR